MPFKPYGAVDRFHQLNKQTNENWRNRMQLGWWFRCHFQAKILWLNVQLFICCFCCIPNGARWTILTLCWIAYFQMINDCIKVNRQNVPLAEVLVLSFLLLIRLCFLYFLKKKNILDFEDKIHFAIPIWTTFWATFNAGQTFEVKAQITLHRCSCRKCMYKSLVPSIHKLYTYSIRSKFRPMTWRFAN